MTDRPSERLHKLAEEFHKFVNGEQSVRENSDIATEQLTANFGLSLSQAKAWLKKEPNYAADESLQRNHDRRGFDRTTQKYQLKKELLLC